MKGKVVDLEIDDFLDLVIMRDRAERDAKENGYKVLEQSRKIEELEKNVKDLENRVHLREWALVVEIYRSNLSRNSITYWANYTPEHYFDVYQFLDPDDEKTKRVKVYGIDLNFAKHIILQEIEAVMNEIKHENDEEEADD